ncbi:NifB/NifX family molybdenum-iron cluster-binding protein [Pseudodesulfovibrio senegalensis]|jgi:predicted Fe-Mo cluster-binding NifX family protein|uniref:Dinitrogenase iron-molybdenum cofactor biosynthesis protein n=1 Tax=Pseudodesulfovibrio senegalensis TaxID=1721087 RepID=A0A6N6N420_9BACT|nr:NifB/NifX family molybdenum-iron cluster-binding protein [Pseudodesulfovibrio senegalensis]KAB1442794.1 dinitrogenase iron-molybdenum cofactor biosynthesis protein [Pseudodesulfovibrio senegalensis]
MNEKQLVCLACYEDRLASVFDNADEFRFYQVDEDGICPAGHLSLPSKDPMDRTSAILACGVTTLVCGALCGRTERQLVNAGIAVRPWVRGGVEEVLDAFVRGSIESLAMPGCRAARGDATWPGMGRCRSGNGLGRRRGAGLQGAAGCRAGGVLKKKMNGGN